MTNGSIIAERIAGNLPGIPIALHEFMGAIDEATQWIQRDWQLYQANPAHLLLTGAKVSFLESATAWAIGSNRGAAASLRAAVENAFAWLYYKDHPMELKAVKERRADMLLPKAVQSYLKSVDGGYEISYEMLKKTKSRSNEYFYTDLSQYVHAHPNFLLNSNIENQVVSSPRDPSFLNICNSTSEFIADNYLASYRASWGNFPNAVQESVTTRLGISLAKFVDIH
ncbi:MAG: hypothetical protein V4523_15575 [Pseudomonadota bacterium]